MNIGYAFLLSFIAGLSTFVGGLFVFLKIPISKQNKFITFALAFSMCIMIGVSITDLLPEAFMTLFKIYQSKTIIIMGALFIVSFLFIKFLHKMLHHYDNELYKLGILSMITLIMHNFPEGMITMLTSYFNPKLGIKLSLAIAMHNLPEGISIALPIYYAKKDKKEALLKTFLSGMSEPLGGIIAFLFLKRFISKVFISYIMTIVSGLMIILSIEEIYPEIFKYKEKKMCLWGFGVGIIFIILNLLLA